ncbi:MAG: Asp-tRNA(Asn)/Glu-tRNA(Gln) amidotransferase subunit GatA [Clostridia bacterium]|nr:Asp-tRNA(Asn)/Glu-tRNA(Gln) amidotransferase subunit GatA [Clostridia bacterium]
MNATELSAREIARLVALRELSAVEVARAYLARREAVDARVRAFLHPAPADEVLRAARAVDEKVARGETPGPLAGVPVAVKDNISVEGRPLTCGSRILEGYRAPYSATAVRRLLAAGALVVGGANMDEFAMGSSTENSAYFPTHNPWDLARVPGGSSGGPAAAVAAQEAALALGSDTGGSVRQPAALCGVVGLKPTYGRVSRYGLVAFASSLDQIGPFARDVTDVALALSVIAGHDPMDATSAQVPVGDYVRAAEAGVRGLRIGVPRELVEADGIDGDVRELVAAALETLAERGAHVEECHLPTAATALEAYYVVAPAEASANLARFDGVRYGFRAAAGDLEAMYARTRGEGFGREVRRRIALGTFALSAGYREAYYLRAQRVRQKLLLDFQRAFARYDLLAAPTSPTVAFPLGERVEDPLSMYVNDICTIPASLAGLPAISVPCGFSGGLPVGLQLIGPAFAEETLFRAAGAYQDATSWHRRRPPLGGLAPAGGRRRG